MKLSPILLLLTSVFVVIFFQNCSLDSPSGDALQTSQSSNPASTPDPNPAPSPTPLPAPAPPPACTGMVIGGYCWHLSALNQSCTEVCAALGGSDAATINYVGSGGTIDNCKAV